MLLKQKNKGNKSFVGDDQNNDPNKKDSAFITPAKKKIVQPKPCNLGSELQEIEVRMEEEERKEIKTAGAKRQTMKPQVSVPTTEKVIK